MRESLLTNIKNIRGPRVDRKIVVFAVDDFGNVRLDSKQARENMEKQGLKVYSRFDVYDGLETADDLTALFEVLQTVKDKHGRPAVFTAFSLPCNFNFDQMAAERYERYHYESLLDTFTKQPDGKATWQLWQEGLKQRLLVAQYHGREHLNVHVLNEKLKQRDREVLTALQNRSYTSISQSGYSTISYSAAFEFWDVRENEAFHTIIAEGLKVFENVFGYKAINFIPPGGNRHPSLWPTLYANGIRYIDLPLIERQHQGMGKYRRVWNYTGKVQHNNECVLVRNAVFEPTENESIDWTGRTLLQIEAAFRWGKPAIISSHRINFAGRIEEANRANGIKALKQLLKAIVKRWPDVEFMSSDELASVVFSVRKDV